MITEPEVGGRGVCHMVVHKLDPVRLEPQIRHSAHPLLRAAALINSLQERVSKPLLDRCTDRPRRAELAQHRLPALRVGHVVPVHRDRVDVHRQEIGRLQDSSDSLHGDPRPVLLPHEPLFLDGNPQDAIIQ